MALFKKHFLLNKKVEKWLGQFQIQSIVPIKYESHFLYLSIDKSHFQIETTELVS